MFCLELTSLWKCSGLNIFSAACELKGYSIHLFPNSFTKLIRKSCWHHLGVEEFSSEFLGNSKNTVDFFMVPQVSRGSPLLKAQGQCRMLWTSIIPKHPIFSLPLKVWGAPRVWPFWKEDKQKGSPRLRFLVPFPGRARGMAQKREKVFQRQFIQ